jgi:hypothetical protein
MMITDSAGVFNKLMVSSMMITDSAGVFNKADGRDGH